MEIKTIGASSLDEAYDLYMNARKNIPYGFLADRSYEDFQRIIASEYKGINIGVYRNERLIAYQLSEWIKGNPYPDCDFLSSRILPDKRLLAARGVVVAPDALGASLSARLSQEREKRMHSFGADFYIGLVHIENRRSMRALMSGKMTFVVGIAQDETSLNFVICVCPALVADKTKPTIEKDIRDIEGIKKILSLGNVGSQFVQTPDTDRLGFYPIGN